MIATMNILIYDIYLLEWTFFRTCIFANMKVLKMHASKEITIPKPQKVFRLIECRCFSNKFPDME